MTGKQTSMSGLGIDYDFRSQWQLLASMEVLTYLHRARVIRLTNVRVYTSPSGRGWHVRFDARADCPKRVLELLGRGDAWPHAFAMRREHDRPERRGDTPLFHTKWRNGVKGEEKYNGQMTKRLRRELLRERK